MDYFKGKTFKYTSRKEKRKKKRKIKYCRLPTSMGTEAFIMGTFCIASLCAHTHVKTFSSRKILLFRYIPAFPQCHDVLSQFTKY